MSAAHEVHPETKPPVSPKILAFEHPPEPRQSKLKGYIRLARPHQWVKNGFLAAPLLMTPTSVSVAALINVAAGIAVFSLLASSIYVINDLCDRKGDALHPTKRKRPIASGLISPRSGVLYATLLLGITLPSAFALGWGIGGICCVYLISNLLYSFKLKHQAIIDVLMVASFYVMRVYAGSWLIGLEPTTWMLNFTGLLALFIAFAKRRDDLIRSIEVSHRNSLSGYNQEFVTCALATILGVLVATYCMYITNSEVIARYGTTQLNWTLPFVMAGVLRYLQATIVEQKTGEPTMFILKDHFLRSCVIGWIGMFLLVVYDFV